MKRLTNFKNFTLALVFALIGVISWGQSGLSGSGTSADPYQIGSATDWHTFVSWIGTGTNVDKYYKLTADITVDESVGTDTRPFKGTFDGEYTNGVRTLTFNSSGSWGVAPFYCTDGATIKNLKVKGDIDDCYGYAAGLVYYTFCNENITYVQDVTVSVNIDASGQGWCGGFAVYSAYLDFSNCIYNGRIIAGENSGGFSASYESSDENATFENCLFDPDEGSVIEGGKTFGTGTDFSSCYYTDELGTTAQGTRVYKERPSDIVIPANINGVDVYMPVDVEITGVAQTYNANGTDYMSTIMACSITFEGVTKLLSASSDKYDVAILKNGASVGNIIACGDYTIRITGKGDYSGTYDKVFYVLGGELTLQDPLSPYSTTNPYLITSTTDWLKLAKNISDGVDENYYADKYYKLTNNITIPVFDDNNILPMVGTAVHPFSGNFNGATGVGNNIYTLTFNYGTNTSPTDEQIIAPFRYTDGATIEYLRVSGAIYTSVGKEAGLIGVNTNTTTVRFIIVDVNLYCDEDLWDEEGGGFAYDGRGIHFSSSAYQGIISAENYHGGFCGNADNTTTFSNCLFNPADGGLYWAENFVWNNSGATIGSNCYYTEGNNQEESEQGTLVYVVYAGHSMPDEIIGKKLTNLYGRDIYEPVNVVISGVNKRYTYTGNPITVAPTAITFNGVNAINNNYCEWSIDPSPVNAIGTYTFTITAPKQGVASDYLGSVTQIVRVVSGTSTGWTQLQAALLGSDDTIDLDADIEAGGEDVCLVVESNREVTINLNGHKIDRGFYTGNNTWSDVVIGGHVLKVNSDATVVINGPGTITGGSNKAASTAEHGENNDGGGIFNKGSLTLNNVIVEGNYCEKKTAGVSRTARGGGIYSGSGSTLIVNNCTVTHNEAKGGGGGLFVEKAAVFEMYDTDVKSNVSQDKGGAVRLNATNTQHNNGSKALVNGALIKDCLIDNNTVELHNTESASNGGGIHLDAGTLYLTNCTVRNNRSSKYGGGIYMMGGYIYASNCDISYNFSYDSEALFEGYGGGVCVLGGTFDMTGGTVTGNISYVSDGGGIFVAQGKSLKIAGAVTISGNVKYNNSLTDRYTTNVYLVGTNDKITISGNLEGASVGVSKNGGEGRFTSGLNGRGTTANFVSDYTAYQVLPDGNEAKLGVPAEMPSDVDDLHLPDGIEKVGDEYVIKVPFTVDQPVVMLRSVRFEEDGCIIITENGILRVPSITNSDPLKIIIDDGGQVIFTGTPGDVAARVKKEVKEFSNYSGYWYLISSPINNPVVSTATNIVVLDPEMVEPTPGYDLYRFNEAATAVDANNQILHWENYRNTTDHPDFTTLVNGRGYLYRSCQDYTVIIDGNLNVGEVTSYILTNSSTDVLKGFNVIGNPYPHNIKKGEGQSIPNTYLEDKYYVLNPEGCVWTLKTDAEEISPFTGILVQAKSEVSATQTLTISDVVASAAKGGIEGNNNIWFTVANSKYEDKVCVEFKEGHGLNKIAHLNENAPMLYINYNGEDFASVDMSKDVKSINLNFDAKTTGYYTLSMKSDGEFDYIHLIDRLTGDDIDMLQEEEYTFIGSASDNADRFLVKLSPSTGSGTGLETFAWQNGNDIIVNGNGELQVFDVMGRMVATRHINGVQTINLTHTGVYIFRLDGQTQKIVVR